MRTFILLSLLWASTAHGEPLLREYVDGGSKFRVYDALYVSCYDGDTCDFNVARGFGDVKLAITVRYCDIQAPEIRPLATREAATVVRDKLISMLQAAKRIELHIKQENNCDLWAQECDERDKYGRFLVYVVADGVNLNEKLLTDGLVTLFTSASTDKPILCKERSDNAG